MNQNNFVQPKQLYSTNNGKRVLGTRVFDLLIEIKCQKNKVQLVMLRYMQLFKVYSR